MATLPHSTKLALIHEAVVTGDMTKLTPELVSMHDEMELAYELLLDGSTHKQVVDTITHKYSYKLATANARIRDAKYVFGDTTKGHRAMDATILFMRAEDIYLMAMGKKQQALDPRMLEGLSDDERMVMIEMSAPQCNLELALKAVETMIKIKGVDKEELQLIDPSKLEASDYQLKLNKTSQGYVNKLLEDGRVDLSEFAVDAEFVVLPAGNKGEATGQARGDSAE